jgi:hypothetical protein
MEGLAQRTIGSEININQIPTHITEPPPIKGREYFSAAADKLAKENSVRNASYRSMSSPVASANDNNTGWRVGMDRAQESEALTRQTLADLFGTVPKTRISPVKKDKPP